jgi:hypothetical protein
LALASLFEASPPIMASRDAGQQWAPDASGLPALLPAQDLAGAAAPARETYLTTMGGGVWERKGSGPWHDISAGLPGRHAMPLLATDASGVLYAGTMAWGVYERVGDSAWRPLGSGLTGPAATVLGLATVANPRPVLLAATSSGVFRYAPPGSS